MCEHHFSAVKDVLFDRTVVFGGTEGGLSLGNVNRSNMYQTQCFVKCFDQIEYVYQIMISSNFGF